MGWKLENITLGPDNKTGTIPDVPTKNSETVFFKGSPMVKTRFFPVGGTYRLVGKQISMGLSKEAGDQNPWVRYWIPDEPLPMFDPAIFDPDIFDTD